MAQKNSDSIEWKDPIRTKDREESPSSSFVNILDLDHEDSVVPSHRSPTLIEAPLLEHLEEFHSSPVMKNFI